MIAVTLRLHFAARVNKQTYRGMNAPNAKFQLQRQPDNNSCQIIYILCTVYYYYTVATLQLQRHIMRIMQRSACTYRQSLKDCSCLFENGFDKTGSELPFIRSCGQNQTTPHNHTCLLRSASTSPGTRMRSYTPRPSTHQPHPPSALTMLKILSLSLRCSPAFKQIRVRFFQTTSRKLNQSGSSKSVTVRNSQLHYQLRGNGPHAIPCIPGALGTALTDFLPQLE